MSRSKNAGYLVEVLETGKQGRTFHRKGTVNGKLPVYPVDTVLDDDHKPYKHGDETKTPIEGSLYALDQLKHVGMAD